MKAIIQNGIVYSPYPKYEIPCCSIYTVLKDSFNSSSDKLCLADDTVRLTQAEVFLRMKRYAAGFQAHGVKPGDRICLMLENSVEAFLAAYGLVFAGATLILCCPAHSECDLIDQIKDGDATELLTDVPGIQLALKLRDQLKIKRLFLLGGEADGFVSTSVVAGADETAFHEISVSDPRNEVAALSYTSGTTDTAKAVEVTHYCFVANLYAVRACRLTEDTDVLLAWYPLVYASGFQFTMTAACVGATCIVSSPAIPFELFVDLVNKFKVNSLAAPPLRLQQIVNQMLHSGTRLPSVKKIKMGGTPMEQALVDDILSAFSGLECLRNMYGMAESCGVVCCPTVDDVGNTSLGYPNPMTEIKICDVETGKILGPNQEGELCFRIPSCTRGYHNFPEKTAELIDTDGWCHSGDVAYYDENGQFNFVERQKLIIKCMDNHVRPREMEELILSHFEGIDEVVVTGIPDEERGEVALAFVVLKESHGIPRKITKGMIEKYVADNCAKYKHLYGGVYFVDHLPKTETGKVKRGALKDLARSKAFTV